MCGRFTSVTWDELLEVARAIEFDTVLNPYPDWPATPRHDVFPNSEVPLLLTDMSDTAIKPERLAWGYMREDGKPVFNTRIETADHLPLWRESFERRHCVVPAWSFYESNKKERVLKPGNNHEVNQLYRFTESDGSLMMLAGIWRDDRFSLLTTEPNLIVGRVHDRMPVVMNLQGAKSWLEFENVPVLSSSANHLECEAVYPAPKQGSLF